MGKNWILQVGLVGLQGKFPGKHIVSKGMTKLSYPLKDEEDQPLGGRAGARESDGGMIQRTSRDEKRHSARGQTTSNLGS